MITLYLIISIIVCFYYLTFIARSAEISFLDNPYIKFFISIIMSPLGIVVAVVFLHDLYLKKFDEEIFELQIRYIKDLFLWNTDSKEDTRSKIKEVKRKRREKI